MDHPLRPLERRATDLSRRLAAQPAALRRLSGLACAEGTPGQGGAAGVECLERWPLYVFLGSATVCLGSSTVYHFFGTANEKWEIALRNVDYGDLVFG